MPHSVKYTRRPTQPVDIFREKDRKWTELVRQRLQPRLRRSIETKFSDTLMESTTRKVGKIVTQTAAKRSPHQHLRKAVRSKKRAVREHSRQKERDVSLEHDENENRVKPVLK